MRAARANLGVGVEKTESHRGLGRARPRGAYPADRSSAEINDQRAEGGEDGL